MAKLAWKIRPAARYARCCIIKSGYTSGNIRLDFRVEPDIRGLHRVIVRGFDDSFSEEMKDSEQIEKIREDVIAYFKTSSSALGRSLTSASRALHEIFHVHDRRCRSCKAPSIIICRDSFV